MQRATSRSSRVQPPVPSASKASFALSSGSNRAEEAGESNITSTMRCVPAFSNVGSRKARSSPLMSLMMRERPCSKLAKADKMATRLLLPSPLSARIQAWTESMSLTLLPISPTTNVPPEGLPPSFHDSLLCLSSPCAEMSLASPWMGAPGARRPPTRSRRGASATSRSGSRRLLSWRWRGSPRIPRGRRRPGSAPAGLRAGFGT